MTSNDAGAHGCFVSSKLFSCPFYLKTLQQKYRPHITSLNKHKKYFAVPKKTSSKRFERHFANSVIYLLRDIIAVCLYDSNQGTKNFQ